jgi:hypothetical protein
MNEVQKKGAGCGWVAVVVGGGLLGCFALAALVLFWLFKSTKSSVREHVEKERLFVLERQNGNEPMELKPDQLADYAAYQAGTPLDRDVFIAWNVDPRRTTLGMESFLEKAEGAMVAWRLRVEDLTPEAETITGNFTIPYQLKDTVGSMTTTSSSSIRIQGEFAREERALLAVRRGDWVEIQGRLSLKGGEPVIREARLAGHDAERE